MALGYEKLSGMTPKLAADARRILVRASFMAKDHATAFEQGKILKAAGKLDTDTARILDVEGKSAAKQQATGRARQAHINERVHGVPVRLGRAGRENAGGRRQARQRSHASHWRPDIP